MNKVCKMEKIGVLPVGNQVCLHILKGKNFNINEFRSCPLFIF